MISKTYDLNLHDKYFTNVRNRSTTARTQLELVCAYTYIWKYQIKWSTEAEHKI